MIRVSLLVIHVVGSYNSCNEFCFSYGLFLISTNNSSNTLPPDSVEDELNNAASKKIVRKRRQFLPYNLKIKKTTNGMVLSKSKLEETPTTCDDLLRKRKYWRAGIYSVTFKEDM